MLAVGLLVGGPGAAVAAADSAPGGPGAHTDAGARDSSLGGVPGAGHTTGTAGGTGGNLGSFAVGPPPSAVGSSSHRPPAPRAGPGGSGPTPHVSATIDHTPSPAVGGNEATAPSPPPPILIPVPRVISLHSEPGAVNPPSLVILSPLPVGPNTVVKIIPAPRPRAGTGVSVFPCVGASALFELPSLQLPAIPISPLPQLPSPGPITGPPQQEGPPGVVSGAPLPAEHEEPAMLQGPPEVRSERPVVQASVALGSPSDVSALGAAAGVALGFADTAPTTVPEPSRQSMTLVTALRQPTIGNYIADLLPTATIAQLAQAALPGLGAILLLTLGGVFLRYRRPRRGSSPLLPS